MDPLATCLPGVLIAVPPTGRKVSGSPASSLKSVAMTATIYPAQVRCWVGFPDGTSGFSALIAVAKTSKTMLNSNGKLINRTSQSDLCFRPLNPKLEVGLDIVWKKSRIFSEAAEKFLDRLREKLARQEQ